MGVPAILEVRRLRPQTPGSRGIFSASCLVFAALVTALVLIPSASAQRTAATHASAPMHLAAPQHFHAPGNFGFGRSSHFRRSSPYGSPYTSLPFLGDSFNPDDIYPSGAPDAGPLPPFLMQALSGMTGSAMSSMGQAMSAPVDHKPSSSDPLMIELQNGRYVRVNNAAIDGEALPLNPPNLAPPPANRGPKGNPKRLPLIATAAPVPDLTPAVLVFRDGHTEEVRDYTIADGMLYARGDYYTDGFWNKKIALAALDLSKTEQANSSRSVKFILPASPNEVITRF